MDVLSSCIPEYAKEVVGVCQEGIIACDLLRAWKSDERYRGKSLYNSMAADREENRQAQSNSFHLSALVCSGNGRDHQHVALPQEFKDRSQFLTSLRDGAASFLGSDEIASGCLQGRLLNGKVLVGRADASVSDHGHSPAVLSHLVLNQETIPSRNIKVNPIETLFLSQVGDPHGFTHVRHGSTEPPPAAS